MVQGGGTPELARENNRNTSAEDGWLDVALHPTKPVYGKTTRLLLRALTPLAHGLRRIASFALTTPGKLFTVTLILTMAIGAAGFSMSQSSAARKADLDTLLNTTEPMSNAAHNLYTSLSLTDTVASTGFVQGGVESRMTREKYAQAIDNSATANAEVLLGSSGEDERIRWLSVEIQRKLPSYTGLVESARANSRQGNAVSTAYMSNASSTMRNDILPSASELFTLSSTKVAKEQDKLTDPQWVPISGLAAAIAMLLLAQWWLWRLTRRKFNRGFLAATALLTIALLWVGIANFAAWSASSRGFDSAAKPWDLLTNSRIEAQQVRTAETLALVTRQSAEESEITYDAMSTNIRTALKEYEDSEAIRALEKPAHKRQIERAQRAINEWDKAHANFIDALKTGDYREATRITSSTGHPLGTDPTAAAAFVELDAALGELIDDSRATMRSFTDTGLQAMTMVSTAVLLLSVLAILSVWLGIRPRLQEYL